jgi:hypothetical protein
LANAFHHLVAAEGPAKLGNAAGCAVDVKQQLGVLVEIAAPGGDLGEKFGETVLDGHWQTPLPAKVDLPPENGKPRRPLGPGRGSGKPECDLQPVADVARFRHIVAKSTYPRLVAAKGPRNMGKRAKERSSHMATKPKEPQQGGATQPSPQQQGQQSSGSTQQAGQPIFRDWASI